MEVKQFHVKHLKINHSPVVAKSFYNKTFTRGQVEKMVEDLANKYKSINPNMKFMVSVKTDLGFRSGSSFGIINDVRLPNISDSDYPEWTETNDFVVYAWNGKTKSNAVGCDDENNDCLFNSILEAIKFYRLPKNCKNAYQLKELLKLNRTDKIPLEFIPTVEDLFKVNINLTGDTIRTSLNKYKLTCNLIVSDDHVKLEEFDGYKQLLNRIPKFQQQLAYFYYNQDNVIIYNGFSYKTMDFNEFQKMNKLFEKYAFIEYKGEIEQLETDYDMFLKNVDDLKELTKGKIDLSRSGYLPSNEALKFIYYSTKSFEIPDEMCPIEQYWVNSAFHSGLIFGVKGVYNKLYEYDKNSAYPSALTDSKFTFPHKQGIFTKLDKLPDFLNYGIYRVKIFPSNDYHVDKLFVFNDDHYYTHYDVNIAKDVLKLHLELIKDNESNALLYPDRINSHQYFGEFIYDLYSLKYKNPLAKQILNSVWGRLCQKKIWKNIPNKENEIDLDENIYEILNLEKISDEKHKLSYLNKKQYFKYNLGRLGAFLTSFVRNQMAKEMYPYKENVVKCHTDSIVSINKLNHLHLSTNLGDWKCREGQGVINKNNEKISWR